MRKLFLKSMLLLCALIVGSSNLWADTAGFTLTGKGGDGASGSISGASETWSYTATYSGTWYSATQSEAWQVGKKSNACSSLVLSTSGISGTITQIDVSCGTQASKGSVNCTVGGNAFGTQGQSAGTGNSPANYGVTPSFTGSASGSIVVTINNTGTYISLKSITVTYSTGGGSDPSISLSSTFVEATEEEKEGTINVTYNNIASVDAEVLFFASDGTTPATYDWLDAEINTTDNTKLDYVIGANTGAARTAYMKVHQKNTDVYSSLITVSQAKKSVDNPDFNLETGSYWEGTNFTITSAGNTIYYTTDGTNPTNTSTEYKGAIGIIAGQKTYKAIAYDTYGNASNVTSRTYTGIVPASLPFIFDGGKNDVENGLVQNGLGTDYNTSPKFKFDGEGDYLDLKFLGNAGDLSFDIKTNGTGTGKVFTVSGSSNGTDFSNIKTYNDAALPANTKISNFVIYASEIPAGTCYIRWTYTTKPSGTNIGLGNINLGGIVPVTITSAGWATYCSPYALDFSGNIEHLDAAYIVTGGAAGVLSMDKITGTVPANTGLLLKGEGECVIPVVASSSTDVSDNKLEGVTEATVIAAEAGYVLMGTPSLGFYKNAKAFTLGANTAYLPVGFDGGESAPSAFRIVDEVNGATDIQNIEANEKSVKFIENGRILILRDGITYDALGRKVR